jgi:hypothetical protein
MSVNTILDRSGMNICGSLDKSTNGVPLLNEYALSSYPDNNEGVKKRRSNSYLGFTDSSEFCAGIGGMKLDIPCPWLHPYLQGPHVLEHKHHRHVPSSCLPAVRTAKGQPSLRLRGHMLVPDPLSRGQTHLVWIYALGEKYRYLPPRIESWSEGESP